MPKKHEFTNEDALAGVTRSIYLGETPDFVVTMAVGYTRSELESGGRVTRRRVLEAFRELLAAEDWEERSLQLWEARTGAVIQLQAEVLR